MQAIYKNIRNMKAFSDSKGSKSRVHAIAFCVYLASLLIFGSNGILAAGVSLASSQIVFFRMSLGAAILAVAFFAMRKKLTVLHNKHDLVFLIGGGLGASCEMLFVYEAYQTAGVAMSTILCYLAPIVVMMLSPILFRERLTAIKGISFAVVVVGSLLINVLALGNGVSPRGILFGLGSAAGLASMVICNKKVTRTPGLERAVVQMVVSGIICTVYIAVTQGIVPTLMATTAAGAWPTIIVIGVLSGIGNLMYFIAISKLSVQSVAVFGYLEPLSAVLMSVAFLGEHMLPLQIVGAAMIIGGALAAETIGKKQPQPSKQLRKLPHAA